jgi:hypothetical protein
VEAVAKRPAALVEVRQRHPAGHAAVVVGGQQDRAGLAGRVGGAVAALDHLEQQDGQVGGRQVPQRQPGLVGPDRDPAGAGPVQPPGPPGLHPGVAAALAVQHDQQRPLAAPGRAGSGHLLPAALPGAGRCQRERPPFVLPQRLEQHPDGRHRCAVG